MEEKKPGAQDELEMDQLAEAELSRLQRQYRIMETDRAKFYEASGSTLRNQKRLVDSLKKEYDILMADLAAEESKSNKKKDEEMSNKVNVLLDKHTHYQNLIDKEKTEIHELEQQIKKVRKSVTQMERTNVTQKQLEEQDNSKRLAVRKLENALDTELKKLSSTVTENKNLREEISHLVKERSHFNQVWQEFVNRLADGKKQLMDLIEQSTVAYDQRDDLCRKVQALKVRGQADLILHTQEMRDLQRKLDHDTKLQEYLEIKGKKRVLYELEAREAAKKQRQKEEQDLKMELYKNILDKIMEFCKEKDIEKIGAQFLKQEEENFALFNYVNELNEEVEMLNESVLEVKKKITEQKMANAAREEKETITISTLTVKVQEETRKAAEAEQRTKDVKEKLNHLLKGIENIFNMVRCDNAPILRLLGESTTVTTSNLMLYLVLIDKKVDHIVIMLQTKEKADKSENQITPERNLRNSQGRPSICSGALVTEVTNPFKDGFERIQRKQGGFPLYNTCNNNLEPLSQIKEQNKGNKKRT